VDLFAHSGILGLALFFWFCLELGRLALSLCSRYRRGFIAGYVHALVAAGIAGLAIMLLADWLLPFVYNIGFPGFQASVLLWLFMGGLVALENMTRDNVAPVLNRPDDRAGVLAYGTRSFPIGYRR
jgi:hypothetical protein